MSEIKMYILYMYIFFHFAYLAIRVKSEKKSSKCSILQCNLEQRKSTVNSCVRQSVTVFQSLGCASSLSHSNNISKILANATRLVLPSKSVRSVGFTKYISEAT